LSQEHHEVCSRFYVVPSLLLIHCVGIGVAISHNLGSKGANLVLNYTSDSSAKACSELSSLLTEEYGVTCLVIQADMGAPTGPAHIVCLILYLLSFCLSHLRKTRMDCGRLFTLKSQNSHFQIPFLCFIWILKGIDSILKLSIYNKLHETQYLKPLFTISPSNLRPSTTTNTTPR